MKISHLLDDDDFAHIVRNAPLVSIDIIFRDHEQKVIVGLRANEPARGTYFVPGGVIRKNETMRDAFARIVKAEIGLNTSLDDARFIGALSISIKPTDFAILTTEPIMSCWLTN